jgi:drug/metabolite transporter (DMT)-like permease
MSILLAYLFYFVAASASPLQRRWLAVNRASQADGQIYLAFQVTGFTAILGFSLFLFEPLYISPDHLKLAAFTIACGIFGAGYFWASYSSQKYVEAGVSSLVSNIYTPVTIALSTAFLGEGLTVKQMIGTALLFVGILVVSKKHRIGRFKFDKYFLLMAASGLMLGVVLVLERAMQKETGLAVASLLSWWAQFVVLGLAVLITKSRHTYSNKDVTVTGVLRFLQSLSFVVLVFAVGNLSIVSSITAFKVVVVFAAAALFLNEREDIHRKILGSAIALAGLLLVQ